MPEKMPALVRILKWTGISLAVLTAAIAVLMWSLYLSSDLKMPDCEFHDDEELLFSDSLRVYGDNWLRLSESGLWEMKVSGSAPDRGYAAGRLSRDLLLYQENVFIEQIRRIIPSDSYLKFLHFFIIMFNRNLGENVPEEFRNEIYGLSQSCTHEFDMIGTPYERQMQYHSAHDIGHVMQDYMMVGCSSFGCWGSESEDGGLIIGRNFDFYMGDDFSRNKLVTFCCPDEGYSFASVGWPGMTGVLSGMNEAGLTVTINASKSDIPTSSATPISILAREILQYASDIGEAYAIAGRRRTFVSESILIGSAKDGVAAIIEKSPDRMSLLLPGKDRLRIVCTNHFQSPLFMEDRRNIENIRTSDSRYRHGRIEELLDSIGPVGPAEAAYVLRNRKGMGGCELGHTNELAVNQLLAHHGVVFRPDSLLMWVSTAPWQCGGFVCYDLRKIFGGEDGPEAEITLPDHRIPPDPFLRSSGFRDALDYRRLASYIRSAIDGGYPVPQDSLDRMLTSNPFFYDAYDISGDYYESMGDFEKAAAMWEKALSFPLPKTWLKDVIQRKIDKL